MAKEPKLARRINLPLLSLYGLGTILGAGIYVLIGKVAGVSGALAPLAFVVAGVIASFTALSYVQLAVRYPQSAGEVVYVQHGFKQYHLATLVGVLIILTGVVSSATLANGYVGYLHVFVDISGWLAITLLLVGFGALAIWGIRESLWVSAAMTCVEILGLLIILWVRSDDLLASTGNLPDFFLFGSWAEVTAIMSGAFLAFYAFIGFEDMVNVVEEVKKPSETMPKAILIALIGSVALYLLIALVAVQALTSEELANSEAPLALLIQSSTSIHSEKLRLAIAGISIIAIVNGVLIQIIMASRILYGMASQERVSAQFARINAVTSTPVIATATVVLLVLIASLWLPLVALAKVTSFVVLIVFLMVNLALVKVQRNTPPPEGLRTPSFPITGAVLCFALLAFQIYQLAVGQA